MDRCAHRCAALTTCTRSGPRRSLCTCDVMRSKGSGCLRLRKAPSTLGSHPTQRCAPAASLAALVLRCPPRSAGPSRALPAHCMSRCARCSAPAGTRQWTRRLVCDAWTASTWAISHRVPRWIVGLWRQHRLRRQWDRMARWCVQHKQPRSVRLVPSSATRGTRPLHRRQPCGWSVAPTGSGARAHSRDAIGCSAEIFRQQPISTLRCWLLTTAAEARSEMRAKFGARREAEVRMRWCWTMHVAPMADGLALRAPECRS
mmetsp:Transcript_8507/g.26701  ORF Transcript_8507/g.26701 Transcript_8507/m.26701 type:complete len:259 (-) Transcript_8507:471-1247(-)